MSKKVIGIMGAMLEEIKGISDLLTNKEEINFGGRIYYKGLLNGVESVVVFSRWGKVAAATTVTSLIVKFNVTELVFTGVAGAIDPKLNIGDVVVGKRFFQHDMDSRPLMKRFEIPLLGVEYFECNPNKIKQTQEIISRFIESEYYNQIIDKEDLVKFKISKPRLFIGDIASGDKFFSDTKEKESLTSILPSVLCVEMEGAAVAQVCYEYNIPYVIIRTMSDVADENAKLDFHSFVKSISSKYSIEIIKMYFETILDNQ